jgi:hypothetical protein
MSIKVLLCHFLLLNLQETILPMKSYYDNQKLLWKSVRLPGAKFARLPVVTRSVVTLRRDKGENSRATQRLQRKALHCHPRRALSGLATQRHATALPSPNPSGPLLRPRTAPLAPPSLPLDHFLPRPPADVRRWRSSTRVPFSSGLRFRGGDQSVVCMFPSGVWVVGL